MVYVQYDYPQPANDCAVWGQDGHCVTMIQPMERQALTIVLSAGAHVSGRNPIRNLIHRIAQLTRRRRAQTALAELPDHLLRDIGLDRSDVVRQRIGSW